MILSIIDNVESVVAHTAEVHDGMKPFAEMVLSVVVAKAERHNKTGVYANSMHLEEGRVDWHIVSDDPDAIFKEFGRIWAPLMGEGPVHTTGVHAFAQALGELGGVAGE